MHAGCYGIEARPRKINRVAHSKKRRGAPPRADITFQLALIGGLDWLLEGRFPRVDLIRAVVQVDPTVEPAFHNALQEIARGDDALSVDGWNKIDLAAREIADRESPRTGERPRSPTAESRYESRVRALRKELLAQRREQMCAPRRLAIDSQVDALRQAEWATRKCMRDLADPALVVWELLTLEPDADLAAWSWEIGGVLWSTPRHSPIRVGVARLLERWILG
jgi:hypothetical protein